MKWTKDRYGEDECGNYPTFKTREEFDSAELAELCDACGDESTAKILLMGLKLSRKAQECHAKAQAPKPEDPAPAPRVQAAAPVGRTPILTDEDAWNQPDLPQ